MRSHGKENIKEKSPLWFLMRRYPDNITEDVEDKKINSILVNVVHKDTLLFHSDSILF